MTKYVLSIDGGGVRGLASATFLSELDKAVPKKLSESFDNKQWSSFFPSTKKSPRSFRRLGDSRSLTNSLIREFAGLSMNKFISS